MNTRERFIQVMRDGNLNVPTMKWEFGYWGETINNWYKEGLPKKNFAEIPAELKDISSSLYSVAWTSHNKYVKEGEYPKGYVLAGGGSYYPNQGFAYDNDIRSYFHMDRIQQRVELNMFFYPLFETKIIEETDEMLRYADLDGAERIYLKESATIPSGTKWPIQDRRTWETIKHERLRMEDNLKRLPKDWNKKIAEYKTRDYPLTLGGYPVGFFGALAHLMGYEGLFYAYYDDPKLVHDIVSTFTELWISLYEEVLSHVEIDAAHIWEDISFGSGCMLPMPIMREFMLPYYKRMTQFLKARGVDLIFVDTDGDCWNIIPFFIEAGVTGMYPFEANCNMDIVKVRQLYPELALMGGIPKSEIANGKESIDMYLDNVKAVLKMGKYIPFADHFIPPDVHFNEFKYYRERLNQIIDGK